MTPQPILISVAPNGARRLKADHSKIPLSPAELASDALKCQQAGAGLIHLHVRDGQGRHSLSPDHYRPALDAVRRAVGDEMIIQITTESVGRYNPAEQMASVRAIMPEAASFAVRELIPDSASELAAAMFFNWVAENGILPQFILYTPAEARRLLDLCDRGIIPYRRPPTLFVLGRHGDGPASHPAMIQLFLEAWGAGGHWSVCAFGPSEIAVAAAALALGGHARVGFENNLLRLDGSRLTENAEQVGRVALIAQGLGRPISTSRTSMFPEE
jgi:3-keto-5-aminohexanoate cleavage enzyme